MRLNRAKTANLPQKTCQLTTIELTVFRVKRRPHLHSVFGVLDWRRNRVPKKEKTVAEIRSEERQRNYAQALKDLEKARVKENQKTAKLRAQRLAKEDAAQKDN